MYVRFFSYLCTLFFADVNMKRLLDDYIFSQTLRYEHHKLIYQPDGKPEIIIGGMMAAAIMAVRLVDQDEGEARGITLENRAERRTFFQRYEREVRAEDGGLFKNEVQTLRDNHIELLGETDLLMEWCTNERLFDLAITLIMEYMDQLVLEEIGEHIYDRHPWGGPFAQWLYEAGFEETYRQRIRSTKWLDAAEVDALNQYIQEGDEETEPTFVFEGLSADELMSRYYTWLMNTAEKEASLFPDADVQMAELRRQISDNELDWQYLKPNLNDLSGPNYNLFYKWMDSWKTYLTQHLQENYPQASTAKHPAIRQLFFPDNITPCPKEDDPMRYSAVREYIKERSRYDHEFKNYVELVTRTELCQQLSAMFGWVVNENSLGKNMRRERKFPQVSRLCEKND